VAISGIEALSEVEVDSDSEMKAALKGVTAAALVLPAQMTGLVETNLKPSDYLDESSSCSELGKDSVTLESHEAACTNFLALHSRGGYVIGLGS
jgi:hypothetical protein